MKGVYGCDIGDSLSDEGLRIRDKLKRIIYKGSGIKDKGWRKKNKG